MIQSLERAKEPGGRIHGLQIPESNIFSFERYMFTSCGVVALIAPWRPSVLSPPWLTLGYAPSR